MSARMHMEKDPLRLAISFLILAIFLPLVLLVWFFIKSVQAERVVTNQQLIGAYRAQFQLTISDLVQNWQSLQHNLIEQTKTSQTQLSLAWLRRQNLQALIVVNQQGQLLFPAELPERTEANTWNPQLLNLRDMLNQGADISTNHDIFNHGFSVLQNYFATDGSSGDRFSLGMMLRLTQLAADTESVIWQDLMDWWQDAVFSEQGPIVHQSVALQTFLIGKLLEIHPQRELPVTLQSSLEAELARLQTIHGLVDFYRDNLRTQTRNSNDHWRFLLLRGRDATNDYLGTFIYESPAGMIIAQVTEQQVFGKLEPLLTQPSWAQDALLQLRSPTGAFAGVQTIAEEEHLFTLELPDPFLRWQLKVGIPNKQMLWRTGRHRTALSVYFGLALLLLIVAAGYLAVRQIRHQIHLNKLQNDFIGMVSHELRTPLASMRMLVETLQQGRYRDSETLREYLDLIGSENQRLSRLVDSFLSFSRMRRGMSQFQCSEVAPGEAVQLALSATRAHMSEPNVTFTCTVEPDLPEMFADPDAVATVLINLLENAYKYSGAQKSIQLTVDEYGDCIRFKVTDNGIGIAPREQKLIFRDFYQVDNRLARKAEGSGLGLSINRHIVLAHNGSIEVESTLGKGSTFTVLIPKTKS